MKSRRRLPDSLRPPVASSSATGENKLSQFSKADRLKIENIAASITDWERAGRRPSKPPPNAHEEFIDAIVLKNIIPAFKNIASDAAGDAERNLVELVQANQDKDPPKPRMIKPPKNPPPKKRDK